MNHWIPAHINKEIEDREAYESQKKSKQTDKDLLQNLNSPNFVLIDAALWGDEIDELFDSKAIYRSLFRGSTGLELWSVAPYLVDINSDSIFIEQLKKRHPIDRRVTWLHSDLTIDELRKHFRRFLRLKQEDGSYIYFRFYDPYVIDTVFPSLEDDQVKELFDGISYIETNDARVNEVHIYSLQENQLKVIRK